MAVLKKAFDPRLLEVLACPLTKGPLRYCEKSQELFNDELGVAYPIVDGVPDLIPLDGRILEPGPAANDNAESPPDNDLGKRE